MENKLDFEGLAQTLLGRAGDLITTWLPGGRMVGHEYVCGNIRGGPGDSFKVNLTTGKWADFASDEKGGDLISLFAAIEGIKQGDAAKRLSDQVGFRLSEPPPGPPPARPKEAEHQIARPPEGTPRPAMADSRFGEPSSWWEYRDKDGCLFYVARYETPEGKQFRPWSWSASAGKWVAKGWPTPRPLYGLDVLASNDKTPALIVEGEKAAVAARKLVGGVYAVVSWPNGAKAVANADWNALKGRKVLIWPDADEPGVAAGKQLAEILNPICPEVKVIDVSDRPDKWDAADALAEKWAWKQFYEWAKPRAMFTATATAHGNGAKAQAQVNVTVNLDADGGTATAWSAWDAIGISVTGQGNPHCNVDNARRILEKHPPLRGLLWYDEFHQKFLTTWNSKAPRQWEDVDDINLATYMQRNLGLAKMSIDSAHQAAHAFAKEHVRNEPREWLDTLKWDGQERIAWFLQECFGAPEGSEYVWAASKNFWVGLVARILRPGCKLDTMIVLEGPQGTFKSTALNIIGGAWYTEAHGSVLEKDFFIKLKGKLMVEIAELDAFKRAEITAIKQVISCRIDNFREPYGRVAQDHPRMSVFAGTTNESNYLRDDTGARRFWPIVCRQVKLDKIAHDREQLFAEAVVALNGGAKWWEVPKEETEMEQESRRQHDEWEAAIYDYLTNRDDVAVRDIARECLGITLDKLDRAVQMRIGGIMRTLGWEKRHKNAGGTQNKVWFRQRQEQLL